MPTGRPRNKGAIKKDRVLLLARCPLERQSDQISESSLRHRVLIGKQWVFTNRARCPVEIDGEEEASLVLKQRVDASDEIRTKRVELISRADDGSVVLGLVSLAQDEP